jgi:hypothetical protein
MAVTEVTVLQLLTDGELVVVVRLGDLRERALAGATVVAGGAGGRQRRRAGSGSKPPPALKTRCRKP